MVSNMGEMSNDLKNLNKNIMAMVNAQKQDALLAGKKVAEDLGATAKIVNNRYLDVDFQEEDSNKTIDLKTAFERGASARKKADGSWYTIVPISRKASSLTKQAYSEVKDIKSPVSTTKYIDILYGGQSLGSDSLTEFGITTQVHGGNLTKIMQGNSRGQYFAFRTVSDKSKPSSWLLLKDRAEAQRKDQEKLEKIGSAIKQALETYSRG